MITLLFGLDPKIRIRRIKSLKRHLPLLLKPTFAAFAALFVWHWIRYFGIHLNKNSEVPVTAAVIPTLGVAYSIMAALVLNTVWEEYKQVSICIVTNDMHKFLIYRDERIPMLIHLLLCVLSFFLLGSMMVLEYEDVWSGRCSVFATAFILVLYWVVATELDDPHRSVWFKERIPQDWLTIDIDEYRKTCVCIPRQPVEAVGREGRVSDVVLVGTR